MHLVKNEFSLDDFFILKCNIIINLYPITNTVWNAKNNGLSTRSFGIMLVELYIYLLTYYAFYGNQGLIIFLIFISFIILLSSQFASQFIILMAPLFSYLVGFEIILIPIFSFLIYYILFPKVFISFIKAQYNHKRNYFLFIAKNGILKERPSIYLDFILMFWTKLLSKENKFKVLYYISKNPIIEVIYGIPYLIYILCFFGFENSFFSDNNYLMLMFCLVTCGIIVFFLTSFKKTRFLGEPQRYLEFFIPLITILFSILAPFDYFLFFILYSISIIILYYYFVRKAGYFNESNKYLDASDRITSMFKSNELFISNDTELLRFLHLYSLDVIYPSITSWYKNYKEYEKLIYKSNSKHNSLYFLETIYEGYNPDVLILNSNIYDYNYLKEKNKNLGKNYAHVDSFSSFDIYKKIN